MRIYVKMYAHFLDDNRKINVSVRRDVIRHIKCADLKRIQTNFAKRVLQRIERYYCKDHREINKI